MRVIPAGGGAALLLSAALPAVAGEAVTYSGTIGTLPVIVELVAEPETGAPFGRYAYRSKGIDIPVRAAGPAAADGTLTLNEEAPCTPALCGAPDGGPVDLAQAPVAAVWTLEPRDGGEQLEGTWRKAEGGRTLPVALERRGARDVKENDYSPLDALNIIDAMIGDDGESVQPTPERLPYDFLKMDHPLKKGAERRLGEGVFRLDTDERVGLSYPVVVSLGGADVGPVNAGLAAARLADAESSWSCLSRAYLGLGWSGQDAEGGTGFEDGGQAVEVDHLTARLVGLTTSGSFWCGGAHPSNFILHTFVDARDGSAVEAGTLLKGWVPTDFDGNPLDPSAPDFDPAASTKGPDAALVDYVNTRRARLDEETERDCGIDDLVRTNLGVYFKQDSMVFTLAGLPHAIFACTNDLLEVPLKDARPLLTETGASYFPQLDR